MAGCGTCRFFIASAGICVINPPMITGKDDDMRASFPKVAPSSSCERYSAVRFANMGQRVTDAPKSAEDLDS